MIHLSIILLNNKISNIYVNTGYYAEKIANEMKENYSGSVVELKEVEVNLTSEELMDFIEKNKK